MTLRSPAALLALTATLTLACEGVVGDSTPTTSDRLASWAPGSNATILHTEVSALSNPTVAVVSDTGHWRALWTATWGGAQAAPPLPPLDFVLSSVVVVGLGHRSGLGYSVTIDSIVVHTVGAVLFATALEPGTACTDESGVSAPVHMVLAPDHPPIIDWQVQTSRGNCRSPSSTP
jgi:hypothetical protein